MKFKILFLSVALILLLTVIILSQKLYFLSKKTEMIPTAQESSYHIPKLENNYTSSINDQNHCNIKDFDPNADCRITQYLEQHTIQGSRVGGVNFCAYQILNDDPTEKSPLYIRATCEEYYPVDYQLRCATEALKHDCMNRGEVGDNFEEERMVYYKDGIKKCDSSCSYIKLSTPVLASGEGYAWLPVKLAINPAMGISHQEALFGRKNDFFPVKYWNKANSQEIFTSESDKKVLQSIGARAEKFFGLKIEDKGWWGE